MKMTVTGRRHSKAAGTEVIVLGYAPQRHVAWQPATSLVHDRRWHRNGQVALGNVFTSGLVGNAGASLKLRGREPLLLVLSHPWSGIVRLRAGSRTIDFDLYSPTTGGLLLDPVAGLAVEFSPSDLFSDGDLSGLSRSSSELLPEAIRFGRSFFPLGAHSPAALPSRKRGLTLHRMITKIRTGLYKLLSLLGLTYAQTPRENILLAIVDGLAKRTSVGTALSIEDPSTTSVQGPGVHVSELEQQVRVLTGIVEGLSRRIDQDRRPLVR